MAAVRKDIVPWMIEEMDAESISALIRRVDVAEISSRRMCI